MLSRRGPARRSPAGVHPGRHRDLLSRGGRDPGNDGRPCTPRVPPGARCRPRTFPAPNLRRGDRALRQRQARPAGEARAHRAHRHDERRELQGVPLRGRVEGRACRGAACPRWQCGFHAQGARRPHAVRGHLRREGPRLHPRERCRKGERGRPAVADREVPVAGNPRQDPRAHGRRERRCDLLRRRPPQGRERRARSAAHENRPREGIRRAGMASLLGGRFSRVRVRR